MFGEIALKMKNVVNQIFKPSGPTATPGMVPSPGLVAGSTRFLREDATWTNPIANATQLGSYATCQGRLTLVSGSPLANNTTSITLYFTPYLGNTIGLYDGSTQWNLLTFTEQSRLVPGTTGLYDVFAYNNAGTVALDFSAPWANMGPAQADGTRTDALVLQDGLYVKAANKTRRYLGTICSSGGTCYDTPQFRYLWNLYNQIPKKINVVEPTFNWPYAVNAWRPMNNNANNKSFVNVITGLSILPLQVTYAMYASTAAGAYGQIAFGYDSTAPLFDYNMQLAPNVAATMVTDWMFTLNLGLHSIYLLEWTNGGGTVTFFANNGVYQGLAGSFWS